MQTLMLLNFDLLNDTKVKLLHRPFGARALCVTLTSHKKVKGFPYFHHKEDEYLLNIDMEPSTHHFPPWLHI